MTLTRPARIPLLCGLAVAGLTVSLAGCDAGAAAGARPGTVAGQSRKVFGQTTGTKAGQSVAPAESVAETAADATSSRPAAPVTAPKPGPADQPPVTLTSAERPASTPTTDRAVPVDPSQFPGGIVPASPNAQPLPGGPRLLVPERNFRTEGRPPALRVNYDDLDLLKVLNMGDPIPPDVVDHFPEWLRDLDGKTVRLRGFMYPSYEEELSRFILTRDTGACCFGPNPKVYYLVPVKMKEGTKARYVESRPIDVTGTFHINPISADGTWVQLYKITDATVAQ